jgi:hypothetical protein
VSLSQQSGSVAQSTPLQIPNLAQWRYVWLYASSGGSGVKGWWTGPPGGTPDGTLAAGLFDTGSVQTQQLWVEGTGQWVTDVEPIANQVGTIGPMGVSSAGTFPVTPSGTFPVAAGVTGGQSGAALEVGGLPVETGRMVRLGTVQGSLTGPVTSNFTLPAVACDLLVVAFNPDPGSALNLSLGIGNTPGLLTPYDTASIRAAAAGSAGRGSVVMPAADVITGTDSDEYYVALAWAGAPSGTQAPYAVVYAQLHGLQSVDVFQTLAASSAATLVAGVAGKTIIVFDWVLTIGEDVAATTGVYGGGLRDTTSALEICHARMAWRTDVGNGTLPLGPFAHQGGLRLPAGAGLQLFSDGNPGSVDLVGTVHYLGPV